jgi:hypothetical protein
MHPTRKIASTLVEHPMCSSTSNKTYRMQAGNAILHPGGPLHMHVLNGTI